MCILSVLLQVLIASVLVLHCLPLPQQLQAQTSSSADSRPPLPQYLVPDIVHQIYDYQSPNFFFYLSILSVQYILQPKRHILYVNDEGRYRKAHWEHWLKQTRDTMTKKSSNAPSTPLVLNRIHDPSTMDYTSFLTHFVSLIDKGYIEVQMVTFPSSPPHNSSQYATNKAHRSDFLRMELLYRHGGIYLDTDAFLNLGNAHQRIGSVVSGQQYRLVDSESHPLQHLRMHAFTLSFDNIVNQDEISFPPGSNVDEVKIKPPLPKRCNNGVLLSAPKSKFLNLWRRAYDEAYHPQSFDFDSSVVPYKLFTLYPDLVHLESHRISPISYGFQTAEVAEALTCGLYIPNIRNLAGFANIAKNDTRFGNSNKEEVESIWYPKYNHQSKKFEFPDLPDVYMMSEVNRKLVLHLTMSQVR